MEQSLEQELSKELDLQIGQTVHDKVVPFIKQLKGEKQHWMKLAKQWHEAYKDILQEVRKAQLDKINAEERCSRYMSKWAKVQEQLMQTEEESGIPFER